MIAANMNSSLTLFGKNFPDSMVIFTTEASAGRSYPQGSTIPVQYKYYQ